MLCAIAMGQVINMMCIIIIIIIIIITGIFKVA